MLLFTRSRSIVSGLINFSFRSKNGRFAATRVVLIALISVGLLSIGIVAGAQVMRSPGKVLDLGNEDKNVDTTEVSAEREVPKRPHVNIDIRVNNQGSIAKVIESNALAGGDSPDFSRVALNQKGSIDKGVARLKTATPDVEATISPLTGAVEVLRTSKALSAPAPGRAGYDIVRDFIRGNSDIYGLSRSQISDLNFIGESVSPGSGLRMVRVEQIVNGRAVFQSETRFILSSDGQVIRSVGLMAPKAAVQSTSLIGLMSSQDALRAAMGSLGVDLAVDKMELAKSEDNGLKTEVKAGDENVRGVVTGKIVYFPVAPGVLVPAWSQVIFSTDADWYVLTDARDGTTLWRKNIRDDVSTQNARFRVYVQADGTTPADNPAPNSPSTALPGGGTQFPAIAPTIVSMFTAMEPTASQNGWIDDCPGGVCTAAQTQTLGNNAIVCMDQTIGGDANICDTSAAGVLDGNGRPTGNPDANSRNRDFLGTTPRDFQTNFLPPPQGGNPEAGQTATGNGNNGTLAIDQFRRGMVTHLFYITNWYHDKLSNLGFNEAAGNFQQLNFSGMGLGNDRVNGDADDGSGTNNANFSTPPDGTAGRMQMYRFTGATIDRDGSLDAEIVMHELTHGTSNRLIGNGAGLAWSVGAGMGEGWSDFYALSLLNNTNADNPDARYASGAYATYKLSGLLDNYVYGIRRFPYSTDNSVNPMTWADTDETTANYSGGIAISPLGFQNNGALEVHNVGEIWMVTLWEMRSRIIADPAGANGNVPAGNQTSLRLVTDALKMTPLNPTFLDARNALLDADCATNACANETSIWAAFADRGLGFKAASPLGYQFGYLSGHLGLVESFESANLDVNGVTVTDTIGNSSGFIDPDEPARVFVNLKNGWRNAAKGVTSATATLTTTTPGVMILDNSSTYGAIAPQANATGDYFVVKAAPGAGACGSSINLTMTITSSLGTVTRNFSIRVGAPSGTAAPVTYSRSAVGLSVPNSAPVGVSDSMNITDDYEIADIDFRVDSLLHTATGDVTVMLKGPTGYGTDLISTIGGGIGGGGTGDDFTNMLIDDSASADMLIAPNSAAPFTGSWKPIFNNASWTTVGFPTDPVGELGRFNGTSTLGTWRVQVSDQAQIANAAGTLNGWSLIVTPRAFVCTAFVPTAAAVSVSGRILDANGQGVSRAVVTLSSGAGGTRTAITNGFGYYRFEDVGVGENYVFGISSKRYQFAPQVITVNEEMTDLNFTAQ